MHVNRAEFEQFSSLDIRVGTILETIDFPEATMPAYKVKIDFGDEIGILKSSAQITDLYTKDELLGTQVLAVVNFAPKQIATFMSQCLVLGIYSDQGVVLLRPDSHCKNGDKLG